jgi:hypothetical protein
MSPEDKKEISIDDILLDKAQFKYFTKKYENMSKQERQDAFYKLLKRVIDLETLINLDDAIKHGNKGVIDNDENL